MNTYHYLTIMNTICILFLAFILENRWIPAIKKAGGKINNIFFYVDRMEEVLAIAFNQ
jgi:hypothetical protein